MIDKSTEEWLQAIYEKLDFEEWYAGHYHVECKNLGIRILYNGFEDIQIKKG